MLWRARGETTFRNNGGSGGDYEGTNAARGVVEIRLDVSSDRMDLLHRAQHFLQEALMAPETLNDPAIRAQVGKTEFYQEKHEDAYTSKRKPESYRVEERRLLTKHGMSCSGNKLLPPTHLLLTSSKYCWMYLRPPCCSCLLAQNTTTQRVEFKFLSPTFSHSSASPTSSSRFLQRSKG